MGPLGRTQNLDRLVRIAEPKVERAEVRGLVGRQHRFGLERLDFLQVALPQRARIRVVLRLDRDVAQGAMVEQIAAPLTWQRRVLLAGVVNAGMRCGAGEYYSQNREDKIAQHG